MSYEKEQFRIMGELIGALSDIADRAFMNDPRIREAERELDCTVEGLALSHNTEDKLRKSISGQLAAYIDAAILYGLRTCDAIRFSSTHADAFSAYVIARLRHEQEERDGLS